MENFQQSIKEFALNFLNFAVVLVIGVVAVKLLLMLIKRVLGKTSLGPSRTMAPLKPEFLEKLELPQEEDMTMAYWQQLHEAVLGKEKPMVTTGQIMRQMKIVEAAFESSRKNEVIKEVI